MSETSSRIWSDPLLLSICEIQSFNQKSELGPDQQFDLTYDCIAKAIYGISRAISRPGSFSMFSRIETHLGRCV